MLQLILILFSAGVPEELSVRSCPSTSIVADIVVAKCAVSVLYGMRMYQLQPCMYISFLS